MLDTQLQALLEPSVNTLGYELVGVERTSNGPRGTLVRVYIDTEEGIRIEDCERVSHQISGVLDVEDPIRGNYTLEVSSPGLDRPLFTLAHFERFCGYRVKLKLRRPLDERRSFSGEIKAVEGEEIVLADGENTYRLPHAQIEKARLVP